MASTAKVLSSLEAARAVPRTAPVRLAPARKAPRERAGSGLELVRDSLGGALLLAAWVALWTATWAAVAGPLSPVRETGAAQSAATELEGE